MKLADAVVSILVAPLKSAKDLKPSLAFWQESPSHCYSGLFLWATIL